MGSIFKVFVVQPLSPGSDHQSQPWFPVSNLYLGTAAPILYLAVPVPNSYFPAQTPNLYIQVAVHSLYLPVLVPGF